MREKEKTMRALLLTAFLLAMTLPACAEEPKAAAPAETVVVSGYQIPAPVRIDQQLEWDDVQDYIPAIFRETPSSPMPAWEIYNEVNRLMWEKMDEYEAALDTLALAKRGDYPGLSLEEVRFTLADFFITGAGADISPDVQKLAYEFTALQYLYEAFVIEVENMGYKPSLHYGRGGRLPPFVPEYPK